MASYLLGKQGSFLRIALDPSTPITPLTAMLLNHKPRESSSVTNTFLLRERHQLSLFQPAPPDSERWRSAKRDPSHKAVAETTSPRARPPGPSPIQPTRVGPTI